MDGPFLSTSACTIHPYRKIFFLDGLFTRHFCLHHTSIQKNLLFGWTQSQNFCLHHTSIQENLLFGWTLSQHFCLHHTSIQENFLFGWTQSQNFCLDHTSIQKNLLFGWTQCNNSQFSGHSIPLDTRHLIKRRAATNPPGFLITDIPRFPEPAPPREDTDPATAERLGLDRRQMRDTIAYSDGKGYMDLISLSSRRRGRHIAQMPPVRAGGRNNSSHIF